MMVKLIVLRSVLRYTMSVIGIMGQDRKESYMTNLDSKDFVDLILTVVIVGSLYFLFVGVFG